MEETTMSGWLPPGVTDKDIDEASPGYGEPEFTDDELLLILAEQIEQFAESDLHVLIELGQTERVKRIIERLQEKMPKRIT
jgi:hypothetical protein